MGNRQAWMEPNRIEFSVTHACTGRCRHCSVADARKGKVKALDARTAVSAVTATAALFALESVMTFGGEPLLQPETVCAIHRAAKEAGVGKRQLITNGYFSKEDDRIREVARTLRESGVNSLLLSVDAFHQEHLPWETVYRFAEAVCEEDIPGFKLHPAWVRNREDDNPFNRQTEECLSRFAPLGIPISEGNNIHPAGDAVRHLADYYADRAVDWTFACGEAPYTERLDRIRTLAVQPNGDVHACSLRIGNIYQSPLPDIVSRYCPHDLPEAAALLEGGLPALVRLAETRGISVQASRFASACDLCRHLVRKLQTERLSS